MPETRLMFLLFGTIVAASMLVAAAPIEAKEADNEHLAPRRGVYAGASWGSDGGQHGGLAAGVSVGLKRTVEGGEVLRRLVQVSGHDAKSNAVGGKERAGPFIIGPPIEDDASLPVEKASATTGKSTNGARTPVVIPDGQPDAFGSLGSTTGFDATVGLASAKEPVFHGKSLFSSDKLDDTIAGLRLHIGSTSGTRTGIYPDYPHIGGDERKDPRSVGDDKRKDVRLKNGQRA